ncbi:hypothetical protein BaRGS_00015473 [Batillaria attramentaria]|uniref:Uncharacterized protein n=1 Tax=Batillaria attramentaria TaxID=370345 RepID=A0ABD0L2R9_9CAEN
MKAFIATFSPAKVLSQSTENTLTPTPTSPPVPRHSPPRVQTALIRRTDLRAIELARPVQRSQLFIGNKTRSPVESCLVTCWTGAKAWTVLPAGHGSSLLYRA